MFFCIYLNIKYNLELNYFNFVSKTVDDELADWELDPLDVLLDDSCTSWELDLLDVLLDDSSPFDELYPKSKLLLTDFVPESLSRS